MAAKKPAPKAKPKSQSAPKRHTAAQPKDLMSWGEYYLVEKAPVQIPTNAKKAIVTYAPWAVALAALYQLQAILLLVRFTLPGFKVLEQYLPSLANSFAFQTIFYVVQLAFLVVALPGLFKRQIEGWNALIVVVFVNVLMNIYRASVLTGVISLVLGLYVLFQVREYYKG